MVIPSSQLCPDQTHNQKGTQMPLKTIAILSPGDMGHGVGKALGEHGYDVITCLAGRSDRTRQLAEAGNFRDVPTLAEMVTQADLIMSILVPAQALGVAESVADALREAGVSRSFADCNAVSTPDRSSDGVDHQRCRW